MKGKALVVDDERNIRLLAAKALEGIDLECSTAVNGEDALRALARASFDLILLDLRMPGMDGIELLRRIRESGNAAKVVVITAHGTVENAVEAMRLGAIDFLQKPFTVEDLRRVAGEALERKKGFFEKYPAQTKPDKRASEKRFCLQQAKAAMEKGAFDDAQPWAEKAISLDPSDPEGFNLLGALSELRNDKTKAQSYYRAAVALDPTYRPAWNNLDRSVGRVKSGGLDLDRGEKGK